MLISFLVTSLAPIVLVIIFAYFNSATIIQNNYYELTAVNLEQTQRSLTISLDSYEDILYQLYTDDQIIGLTDSMNKDIDVALSRNQLQRILRGILFTKDYLQSITIITQNGAEVFAEKFSGYTTVNVWLENYDLSREQIYQETKSDNETHIYPTQYVDNFAGQDYYLFHMAHRIVNYRNVGAEYGIVVLSIDERLLSDICVPEGVKSGQELISFNFIADNTGRVISYADKTLLAKRVFAASGLQDKAEAYEAFVAGSGVAGSSPIITHTVHDDILNWDIISVANQTESFEQLSVQQNVLVVTLLLSVSAIVVMILLQAKRLTQSIKTVVDTMSSIGHNDFTVRLAKNPDMPLEIETIATNFNSMMTRLEESVDEVKKAGDKQREAEIAALEAQIDPHFLYNTLDTINWMAIESEEYEISNAIGALAAILRYGVHNSNGIVTIKEELDWLNQYLTLQKIRLKNSFSSEISVETGIESRRIHKMLLQPFVENAIIHGFEDAQRECRLAVKIARQEETLLIEIIDNGCGMSPELVERVNRSEHVGDNKSGIGTENAISRIKMYYGDRASVTVFSEPGKGTTVRIVIPHDGAETEDEA